MSVLALAQPALGVVTQAAAAPNAAWIAFHNDSSYDLLVAFNPQPPAVPLTPDAGLVGWDIRIASGHYWTQYMPPRPPLGPQYEIEQQSTSFPLPFQGRLQLLLINYGGTAANGTQSSRANVWIQSGTAQEPAPDYSAALPYGSAFQQQRVIALPSAIAPFVGTFAASSGATAFLNRLNAGGSGSFFALTANNITNAAVNVYLYGGSLIPTLNDTTLALQLNVWILNSSNVKLGTALTIWKGEAWSSSTNKTHDIVYLVNGTVAATCLFPLAGLLNPYEVGIELQCVGANGTTPQNVDYNVIWGIDTANAGTPGPVGAQAGLILANTQQGPY